MFRKALTVAIMAGLAMAGCSGSSTSSGGTTATTGTGEATGTPIVLGAISTNSGTNILPQAMKAAEAVFGRLNHNGGINGHPVDYFMEDDGGDPAQAAVAAKRLVEERKVAGFVGGGSLVDCGANAAYYASKGVYSLPAFGSCTDSPTVAQLNNGSMVSLQTTLTYMVDTMKTEPVCLSALNLPSTDYVKNAVVPTWERTSGHKLQALITTDPHEDLTPAINQARSAGCKGVVLVYPEADYVAYFLIAAALGLGNGQMKFAMPTSGYSSRVLAYAAGLGDAVVANSEFLPFTDLRDKTPELADFMKLMRETGQSPSSLAQAGYLAANIAISALRTVPGEYTAESVGKAFRDVKFTSPLLAEPFVWGQYPNRSSKFVQVKGGLFVPVTDWLRFPLQ
jgi:branched-chain amino acid transport system substrate-binding protein